MKTLFLFVFISVNFILLAQNSKDQEGRKQGYWVKKFPNSNATDYTGQFKDDKPIGTFIYYFTTGKKKAQVTYINPNTTYTIMFHENEEILAQGKFINQLKDSTWNIYSPSGKISIIENYTNGILNGERLVFYPLGNSITKKNQVSQKQYYLNGKLNGKQVEYFDNGKTWRESNYQNGIKEGEELTYNPYGYLEIRDFYVHGDKNGWCYAYDSIGNNVTSKVYFKYGTRLDSISTLKYLQNLQMDESRKYLIKQKSTQTKGKSQKK